MVRLFSILRYSANMSAYGKHLNPSRQARMPLGVKADRHHEVITHNPSSVSPGETLYVRVPKLQVNTLLVPGTFYLTFDLASTGPANNYFVSNIARGLQARIVDKLGGEILSDLDYSYLYQTYRDLWLSEKQRRNMTLWGIGSKNLRKLRSNADDAVKSDAVENKLDSVFKTRYCIPIDFELYSDHGPFYPFAINEDFVREITFNTPRYAIEGSATGWSYSIKNLALEYDTVYSEELARQVESDLTAGVSFMYDYVTHFRTQSTGSSKMINTNVNVPRRSMKGLLIFFQEDFNDGEYDSESTSYKNPDITNVDVIIEGISHKIYKQGLKPYQQWSEVKRHFMPEERKGGEDSHIDEVAYLAENKYALWVDLRSTEDNSLHGSGLRLVNTKDGVQLAIKRSNTTDYTMHIFVVADAQVNIQNNQLKAILF